MSKLSNLLPDYLKQLNVPIGPLLITGVVIAAHISFGILDGWVKFLVAIAAAVGTESVLHRLVTGEWRNLSSAYISGNSAGILVRSPFYWPFALCAMISIASKYVLRYKGRHIWNPTNFGIVAIILLASDSAAVLSIQWGSNMWAMFVIWLIGFLTLSKIKLFHVSAVYVLSFFFFGWLRSLITGDPFLAEIAPITGPMYQLFVLFMITDPKTTVSTVKGRCVVAFLIGFVEFIFRLNEAVYAPFYALFIVGPIALIAEDWYRSKFESADGADDEVYKAAQPDEKQGG
jgi:enediyne biosynthesis protein E5